MSKLLIESANGVRILKFNRPEKINAFDAELWQLFADGLNDADQDASIKSVICLLYTSPSPRDGLLSRMPSSA